MARRKGTIERRNGRWYAKLSLPGGRRVKQALPHGISEPKAREMARAKAEEIAALIDSGEYVAPEGGSPTHKVEGETAANWFDRWFADRAARGVQTRVDAARISVHVLPIIGTKPMAKVRREAIERIVETLDRKVQAGSLKWKSARNVWGVVSKAFDDAAHGKTRDLKVRPDNPAADVRGPDRGEKTLKQYLYPSEVSAFVSCPKVPIGWRVLVALGTYLYLRPAELEALKWEDVDIERGTVHVHRAINREKGEAKATKTKTPRKFRIEPVLLPLLRAMHDASGGVGNVVTLPSETNHARALRTYLNRAGVTRAELHASSEDKSRKAITFYDCRSTGITWRAVRGDEPLKIMADAGHTNFQTTQGYIREVVPIREGFGIVFPILPASLLEANRPPESSPLSANDAELLCRRRDLNPARVSDSSEKQADLAPGNEQHLAANYVEPGRGTNSPGDKFWLAVRSWFHAYADSGVDLVRESLALPPGAVTRLVELQGAA